ncbi:hypothetical protein F401_gp17 [Aeromonas phage phiAS7]|uniref:Uncharacterized protein n=1 Tax=Aeromonas phage phiAS7 TaxID=1141132 RepID=H6UK24_9CAUD|nr:hypothetical protein F401_gp17 [Aeromonas phage phiAS7]AEZ65042.1 hypothetical protein phiAS7_00017 [Aeromonas phage phiAS7]
MHIMTDVLVTAAALAAAINPLDDSPLLDVWDQGCVELYHQIGEWAGVIDKIEAKVSELVEKHDGDWPGVFAYEVTENVGTAIRAAILEGKGDEISEQWVQSAALALAVKFCGECPVIKEELLAYGN